MSLQFVIGNSGSGKSTYLYEQVIQESLNNPKKNYIVIVPEQFTMQTQKELVSLHPSHGIMNIDVLSFDRLAYRVFDELGTSTLTVLEETGKNLVLRKVAENKKDELTVLKGNMTQKGYISEMKSLISELTQYNIDPERFEEMMECNQMSKSFRYKAQDILIMYQGFLEYIQGKYITTEEILQLLCDVIDDSKMVRDSVMVFDGFTGFTPIQNQVIRRLLTLTEQMTVTVTMDVGEECLSGVQEAELFAMSKQMIHSLMQMAKETRTTVLDPVKMDVNKYSRFTAQGALQHLEQNLFRKKVGVYTYTKEDTEIEIYSLNHPRAELAFVAGQIRQEIQRKGYHYRDCAIVCASLDTYKHYVPAIFQEYELPYFIDDKSDIVFHPLIEMISGAFEMICDYFSYESVSRFLRCGLHQLTTEQVDEFDNYIYAAGIRGKKKYLHPFTVMPRGYSSEQLVAINQIREQFMKSLIPFMEAIEGNDRTVEEISRALYLFLVSYDVQHQLEQKAEELESANEIIKAREYEEIYGLVMDLLDKMVSLLADETMDAKEYAQIFMAGMENASVGIIPPSHDSVVIGDIERTRLDHMKVIYLIGANDGAIPKSLGRGGILSQIERQQLKEADFELAPTDREKAFMQKFYLYLMMTKPSDKLVISYARVDTSGSAVRKSYLIAILTKMFRNLTITEIEQEDVKDRILTKETTRKLFIEKLRDYVNEASIDSESPQFLIEKAKKDEALLGALWMWYQNHPKEDISHILEAAFYYHGEEEVKKEILKSLFGENIKGSVTRLEQYAKCAYAYFLNYGLKLEPRKEHELETVDMGSLYHDALDRYSKLIEQNKEDWFTITDERSEGLLKQAILETYQAMTKTELMENPRDVFVLQKMEKTLHRSVWALTKQIRQGKFVPKGFEVSFQEIDDLQALSFQLNEMESMQLNGKIDRIDTYETDENVYVKIIDYKSGNQQLNLLNMYHGLQIQLVLYMSAAVEGMQMENPNKQVLPGGMFYYHIDNPIIEAGYDATDEEITQGILKELRMRGVVNQEEEVIRAMDQNINGTSYVIPVGFNKDGSIKKNSKVISTEEFEIMEDYVQKSVADTGRQIISGNMDTKPYKLGDENGCTYCPFHAVCGFDCKIPGYQYRELEAMTDDTAVLERMQEELTEHEKLTHEQEGNDEKGGEA